MVLNCPCGSAIDLPDGASLVTYPSWSTPEYAVIPAPTIDWSEAFHHGNPCDSFMLTVARFYQYLPVSIFELHPDELVELTPESEQHGKK